MRRRRAPFASRDSRPFAPAGQSPIEPTAARTKTVPPRVFARPRDRSLTGLTRGDRPLREFLFRVPRLQAAARLRLGVRLSGLEKGGRFGTVAAMLAEFQHPLPQAAVGNAKLLSDFSLATPVIHDLQLLGNVNNIAGQSKENGRVKLRSCRGKPSPNPEKCGNPITDTEEITEAELAPNQQK